MSERDLAKIEVHIKVKIPKAMADFIRKQGWFKYYEDLDDFVVEAVRHRMENWKT